MADAKGTYVVETYGCQMNVHDSERIAGLLEADGYAPATTPETADVVVVNTCSVRERAEEKLFTRLGEIRAAAAETGHRPLVAVAGCVAQQEGAAILKRSKLVDVVVGTQAVKQLPSLVARAAEGHARAADRSPPARGRVVPVRPDPPRRPGPRLRDHHRRLQRVLFASASCRTRAATSGCARRRDPRRGAPRRRDRPPRGAAARADRQPLPGAGPRRRRLRRAARARARGRRPRAHPLRQPASAAFLAADDRRDPRPAEGLQAPPHAGAVRFRRRSSRRCGAAIRARTISIWSPRFARRSPASRCRRT